MATYAIINPHTGEEYNIELTPDEIKRFEEDFTNQKLREAKDASLNEEKENTGEINLLTDSSNVFKWPHKAILFLIEQYQIQQDNFNSGKVSQKKIWEAISKKLIEKGYRVNGLQCMSKLQGLKRTYKATKDHNSKSGNNARSWRYFDVLNDLFGKKHINPVATVSSTGLTFDSSQSQSNDSDSESTPKRAKTLSNRQILLQIYKSKETHEINQERRHQEKMKQRNEAIEVMKQLVASLNK